MASKKDLPLTLDQMRFGDLSVYDANLAAEMNTVGQVVRAVLALKVPMDDIEGLEGLKEVTLLQRMVIVQAIKAARGSMQAFQELVKHHSYDGATQIALTHKNNEIDHSAMELMRVMGHENLVKADSEGRYNIIDITPLEKKMEAVREANKIKYAPSEESAHSTETPSYLD